ILGSHTPSAGVPFSALTPSIWPQEILATCAQLYPQSRNDCCSLTLCVRVCYTHADPSSSRLPGSSLVEEPQQTLKWQAHLEFTHNHDVGDLTWDKIAISLPRSEKLRSLVLAGIPHSMRPQLWMRLSGALQKKHNSELSYRETVKNSSNDETIAAKQVRPRLFSAAPSNISNVSGVELSNLNEDMVRGPVLPIPGKVAACLLLFLEEEDAFWMMCAIVEDLLPASYFSTTLLGVQTDQRVLRHLIVQYLPRLDKLLQEHDIELSLITLHWFLTAFASVVPLKLLLRIWDLFFYEGSLVLFQTALGMLHLKEEELIQSENSASIFNTLSDIPSQIEDAELLLGVAMRLAGSLTDVAVETQRRKHLAYLIADQGQLLATSTTTHLSQVVRRRAQRRKSGITSLLFGEDDLEALKAKNIKQTELVADLREAILRVARHFQCTDPKNCSVELAPDYSTESHQRDHENYVACSRSHRRRAKALLDFERHDDDELGFRKNDIITIISQKDEHCWVGELNGLRGWFPAKFVEVLDERSKEYSIIVGGHACSVGHTCPPLMCSPSPQAAGREVERDFDSVYSRLVLCKTYRLDEDGKVLTPEELLYRAVQSVNVTHDAAHAQMDVKLRSLICVGLKAVGCEQEPGVGSRETVRVITFSPRDLAESEGWAPRRRPQCRERGRAGLAGVRPGMGVPRGWPRPAGEGEPSQEEKKPLKEGVQDMLVKHHLFSWDIDG
uniref:RUN and TBC1 domain-containing protein 3 n=1 Tax=Loxodonta africana TaxID=9785 RepID=G3SNC1_LOXAF